MSDQEEINVDQLLQQLAAIDLATADRQGLEDFGKVMVDMEKIVDKAYDKAKKQYDEWKAVEAKDKKLVAWQAKIQNAVQQQSMNEAVRVQSLKVEPQLKTEADASVATEEFKKPEPGRRKSRDRHTARNRRETRN